MSPGDPPAVRCVDLSVFLGGLPILRGISLSLAPGSVTALLGGNGSGKSTLVRTVLGLVPHQRGSVELLGRPLSAFKVWRDVGYVPQRVSVALSSARLTEVVAAGRLARRRPFLPGRPADRTAVMDALRAVGLAERAADPMSVLSGGQQQRVLIARALAGGPRLLLLDEPTAGVDLEHQRILAGLLGQLAGRGVTILVVLHEVGPLAPLIDRAVVLREGRIAYDGELGTLGQSHHAHDHEAPTALTLLDGAVER